MKLKKEKKQTHDCDGRKGLIDKATSFVLFGPSSYSNNHGPQQKSQSTGKGLLQCLGELGDPRGKSGR